MEIVMTPKKDDRKLNSARWLTPRALWITFGVYIVLWIVYGSTVWVGLGSEGAGRFGDTFGGFNAFVSGLAMLGVVAAIFLQKNQISMQGEELRLQRHELELQRRELELTRAELERSADAQKASAELLARQLHVMERQYAPVFRSMGVDTPKAEKLICKFVNDGGSVRRLKIEVAETQVTVNPCNILHHNQQGNFIIMQGRKAGGEVAFVVSYTDARDQREAKRMKFLHDSAELVEVSSDSEHKD